MEDLDVKVCQEPSSQSARAEANGQPRCRGRCDRAGRCRGIVRRRWADAQLSGRAEITAMVARLRLPAMYGFRELADAGRLMSYGYRLPDAYRQSARLVVRILKGDRPGDLPFERPARYEFIVNKAACMVRPCSARGFVNSGGCGLASMYASVRRQGQPTLGPQRACVAGTLHPLRRGGRGPGLSRPLGRPLRPAAFDRQPGQLRRSEHPRGQLGEAAMRGLSARRRRRAPFGLRTAFEASSVTDPNPVRPPAPPLARSGSCS